MIKLLGFLLLATIQVTGKPRNDLDPHVVGGIKAQEGSFPALVSLRRRNEQLMCGGSFVSEKYIVTAAHCLNEDPDTVFVGTGSVRLEDQKLLSVKKFMQHPDWNPVSFDHDIGLIELKEPVQFSKKFQPLRYDYAKNVDGKYVTAAGWGRTGANSRPSPHLLYLEKTVLSNEDCLKAFNNTLIKDYHVCLASEKNFGMCMGDSGGPLILEENDKAYVIGVVSWGIPCAVGYPDAFTRVSSHFGWLNEIIKKN